MQFDGIVFPGQGTQFLGMGKDFVELYEEAKQVFNIAKQSINTDLYSICQSDEAKLNNTEYTQPCIVALEIAMYRALKQNYRINPKFFAGHSLGEYSALVAAEVIPLDIALKIVKYRGKLMQETTSGSMVAIISEHLPLEEIKSICDPNNIDIANDNSINQIVISGYTENIKTAVSEIEAKFTVRSVYLNVKAPFHSRYMQPIEEPFKQYLLLFKQEFNTNNLVSVISNYYGDFYPNNSVDILIEALTKQLSSSVKWRNNMDAFIKSTNNILEIGPASPLRGFFKSIGINIQAITNTKTLNKAFMDA
jgi:[acyl-carrier-protein] S-malonyltransferase